MFEQNVFLMTFELHKITKYGIVGIHFVHSLLENVIGFSQSSTCMPVSYKPHIHKVFEMMQTHTHTYKNSIPLGSGNCKTKKKCPLENGESMENIIYCGSVFLFFRF